MLGLNYYGVDIKGFFLINWDFWKYILKEFSYNKRKKA